MLSVTFKPFMLIVIMLSVIMQNVVAPWATQHLAQYIDTQHYNSLLCINKLSLYTFNSVL
jgi:hypothetical protein